MPAARPGRHTSRLEEERQAGSKVQESGKTQPSNGPARIDAKKGKDLICYNCKKPGHPVHACPNKLSKEHVAQILEERKKKNKQYQKSDYVLVCRIDRNSSEDNNCRVLARIAVGNYVIAVLDSGTIEVCIIPKTIADEAISKANIEVEQVDPPVKLRIGDNETEIESTGAVTVNIRLKTKAGELIARNDVSSGMCPVTRLS
jgi:hypothetical protein